MMTFLRTLLTGIAVLAFAPSLFAQIVPPGFDPPKDERRPYVQFPIGKDAEAMLKERLALEQQLGPFKDLVRQILADPDKFGFDPAMFKDVKMDDPKLKKAVQDWAANDPELRQAVRDWVEKMPKDKRPDVQKLQKELKEVLKPAADPPKPPIVDLKPAPVGPQPVEPKADPLAQAAEKAMIQAEKTKLGDWLRDSQAWKRAFQDVRGAFNADANQLRDGASIAQRIGLTPDKMLSLTEGALKQIRDMPKPNLERFQWERPLPVVGNLPTPAIDAPNLPNFGAPSMPSLGTVATWLLLFVAVALALWQLLRFRKRAKPKRDHRVGLGPWPVRPESVATRTELIRAFDYLALWSLGTEVQTWNHQAIARRWSEQAPEQADVAQMLAALYETARYTDGIDEPLPPSIRDEARRSLLRLREAF